MQDWNKSDKARRSQSRALRAQYHRADRVQGRLVRLDAGRKDRREARFEIRNAILNFNDNYEPA